MEPMENGLPPAEVRFITLAAEPWPEEPHKIRVSVQITPFLERPDVEAVITGAEDQVLASIIIVETIDDRMTFTMHIRGEELSGLVTLRASLSYKDAGIVDQKRIPITLLDEGA